MTASNLPPESKPATLTFTPVTAPRPLRFAICLDGVKVGEVEEVTETSDEYRFRASLYPFGAGVYSSGNCLNMVQGAGSTRDEALADALAAGAKDARRLLDAINALSQRLTPAIERAKG